MFLKNLKQISLLIFGFFYSFIVITVDSFCVKLGQFLEILVDVIKKGGAPLLLGIILGYAVYCFGCTVAALVIGLLTGTPIVPILVGTCSPLVLLSQLSLLLSSPIGLAILVTLISLPVIYAGIATIGNLVSFLWHSTMDFYDRGLIHGLRSPFKYCYAVFKIQQYGDDYLERQLEDTAIITKADIMKTVADRYSHSVQFMLGKFLPTALIPIITKYAFTPASTIPKEIDSRDYTSCRQNITIKVEDNLCSFYGIFRDKDTILKKKRDFYNRIKMQERAAVFFEGDIFLQSLDSKSKLKDKDILDFTIEHATPTLTRKDNMFSMYEPYDSGVRRTAELKLSDDETVFFKTLPFAEGVIKRTNPGYSRVVEILNKYEILIRYANLEEKDMITQIRSARFSPLV